MMPDLPFKERSSPSMIVGGDEQNAMYVTSINEATMVDTNNNGGLDTVLTVGTSPVELKVGATKKTERKYVIFLALDKGISFGFSNITQNIPMFKNQLLMLPVGVNTEIWFVGDLAGLQVAVGEL